MLNSNLFDETTFYDRFKSDLNNCKQEVIIESPFITINKSLDLIPNFKKLLLKDIKISVITRMPEKHKRKVIEQSERIIQ